MSLYFFNILWPIKIDRNLIVMQREMTSQKMLVQKLHQSAPVAIHPELLLRTYSFRRCMLFLRWLATVSSRQTFMYPFIAREGRTPTSERWDPIDSPQISTLRKARYLKLLTFFGTGYLAILYDGTGGGGDATPLEFGL